MQRRTLPKVGFDRFVTLEWADYALDLALTNQSPQKLREWLAPQITGHDALHKTCNTLSNLWIVPYPETEPLRQRGLELAQALAPQDRLVLHWGMALANFPLFRLTTRAMGKLLRLQGDFRTQEIVVRVLEQNNVDNTIVRSVTRIIQSISSWGVIHRVGQHYQQAAVIDLHQPAIIEWLLEIVLFSQPTRQQSLVDLMRANELFPFEFMIQGRSVVHESSRFAVFLEGLDRETVGLIQDDFS
jgi:hypothetical protein